MAAGAARRRLEGVTGELRRGGLAGARRGVQAGDDGREQDRGGRARQLAPRPVDLDRPAEVGAVDDEDQHEGQRAAAREPQAQAEHAEAEPLADEETEYLPPPRAQSAVDGPLR